MMASTARSERHKKTAGTKRPKKVLIVEGYQEVAELIAEVLSDKLGLETAIAGDALAARAIITGPNGPFDLVVTNMYLEREKGRGMNGLELIRWLERESPATHALLMSSYDIGESHAVTFLKPIKVDTLVAVVRAELSLR